MENSKAGRKRGVEGDEGSGGLSVRTKASTLQYVSLLRMLPGEATVSAHIYCYATANSSFLRREWNMVRR